MAQFRCSVILLRVETGRYLGEHANEKICIVCNQAFIEDESHFLLNCPCYKTLHEYKLGTVQNDVNFSNKCGDDKLYTLLNNYVRRTAKFLLKSFS